MSWIPISGNGVFSVLSQTQDMRGTIAQYALSRGAKKIEDKDYEGAAAEFKRAAAMNPNSATPYIYLGKTYTLLGRNEDAVAAFQKAVKAEPDSTDAHSDLGGAYVAAGKYAEAEKQYLQALKLDPTSAATITALGYVALMTGRYGEAEARFQKAASLAPRDPDVYYNLGLAFSKQKRYAEAVAQFDKAITIDPTYADAYSERGQAYAGLGQDNLAEMQVGELLGLGTLRGYQLAVELEATLYTPKLEAADTGHSSFNPYLTTGAPLVALDPSLATPGAVKTFSMVFRFNQDMDTASVQNVFNWSITQASGGTAGVYDNGVVLQRDREVFIGPIPKSVYYDPSTHEATVYFTVRQNEAGNGVIDPSHWVFAFSGKDVNGNPIDPDGNQWDGFAGKPF